MFRIATIFYLLFPSLLIAQGYPVVLEAYVEQGLQSNLTLNSHRIEVAKSLRQLEQAKALFMPQIALEASYTLAQGGRSIDIPIGDLLNPVYATLNQMLAEEAFPTLENVSEQFLPHNFHDTRISLVQPLFNSDIYFGHKAREKQVEVKQAMLEAYRNELTHEIRTAYFQHLQAREAGNIYREVRKVLEEGKRVNEKLVAAQKATPDVLSAVASEVARVDQQLAEANSKAAVSRSYFNFLLNRALDAEVEVAQVEAESAAQGTSPGIWFGEADAQRQELQALQHGIDAGRSLAELSRYDAFLPDLYLAGQVGFQGFGYRFNDEQAYWLGQVGLKWDLFQGGQKKARRAEALLEVEALGNQLEQLRQQLHLQVVQTWQQLEAAGAAEEAAQAGLGSAREAFRLVNRRYEAGSAIWLEWLQARNQLTTAQLSASIQRYAVLIAQERFFQSLSRS